MKSLPVTWSIFFASFKQISPATSGFSFFNLNSIVAVLSLLWSFWKTWQNMIFLNVAV